jgi:DNA-directed RNA polymerase specialized sigma24 family protein
MGETRSHFEELLLPHLDSAYNLARWLIENDQDAQAIVQEAYLQARQEFAKSREAGARNWLLAIVRKKAGKWVEQREESSKPILLTEAPREQHSSAIANKFLTLVTDEDRRRLLCEAFSRLPAESLATSERKTPNATCWLGDTIGFPGRAYCPLWSHVSCVVTLGFRLRPNRRETR